MEHVAAAKRTDRERAPRLWSPSSKARLIWLAGSGWRGIRDPKGVGTDAELKALDGTLRPLGQAARAWQLFKTDLDRVVEALKTRNTLEALKAARAMQRKIEERAFEQYPVPPSRRNAPLVFDEKNRVFVLFGGDHEDYQMNDTWILDLEKKSWRRAKPELAPSPRAGHAMVYLPKSGRVAVYEGYAASSDPSYGATPATTTESARALAL